MVYQIDDTTAVASQPALPTDSIGTPGFFTGGSTSGGAPTRVRYWWLNMVQQELLNIALAAGLTADKTDNTQCITAIKALAKAAASGAVVGSPGVLATGDVAGAVLYYSAALKGPAFTYGTTTVGLVTTTALDGYVTTGALTTALANYLPLAGGKVSGLVEFKTAPTVPDATAEQNPVALGQIATLTPGRLLQTQRFDTAGTFTFTPTSGANFWRVRVQGAGGSGGSAAYNEGASVSVAHSGGGGTFALAEYTAADLADALAAGIVITVGAGGARLVTSGAINGLPGNNGAASSFGSLVTCVGGYGGNAGTWSNSAGWSSSNSIQSAVATGTNIKRCIRGGSPGAAMCFAMSSAGLLSFPGGGSAYGDGAPAVDGASQNAWDASNPGTGGSGICLPQNQANAMPGGAGADGLVEIEEWLVDESA